MSEHDETNTNAQRAPHSASPAPSAPTHSTPADDTQWSVLQERAEVREDNLDSQTQDPRIAAQIDAARARGFVPLSESESERTAKNSPEDLQAQIEAGLTQVDPLMVRPRISSRILCGVIALVFALLAFGSYRLGVHTLKGQGYEDLVIGNFANYTPQWLLRHNLGLTDSVVVISVSISLGAIAVFVALLRRRWWLAGQLVAFAAVSFACARVLKPALPRPLLMQIHSSTANSAPSGHTMLAITAGLMLVCAVPRAWRAACALFAAAYSMLVGVFVIADKWHRPCDVLMAVFLVGALAMLMLLFTRRSGMVRPGKRLVRQRADCLNRAHHARHLRFRLRRLHHLADFPRTRIRRRLVDGRRVHVRRRARDRGERARRRRCAGRAPAHCVAAHTSGPDRRPARASAPLIARCRRPCAVPPYRPYCLRDVVISYGMSLSATGCLHSSGLVRK